MKRNQESKSATAMRVANENEAREEPTNDQDLDSKRSLVSEREKNGEKSRMGERIAHELQQSCIQLFTKCLTLNIWNSFALLS